MKNPVVVDVQFIFDADQEIWKDEEAFKKEIIDLLVKKEASVSIIYEKIDDSYAQYKLFIDKE